MGGLIPAEFSADRRPVLTTGRLRLDPLTPDHLEHLVALDADPAVMRFLTGRGMSREQVVRRMPLRLHPDGPPRGIGYWAGFELLGDDRVFAGWWSLGVDPEDPTTAELGYRLRREAWGRGLATEGSVALLDHAFRTLALPRVWAGTMAVNRGSRGVLAKLGMSHVRTEVHAWDEPLPGAEQGEVYYELTRSAWLDR